MSFDVWTLTVWLLINSNFMRILFYFCTTFSKLNRLPIASTTTCCVCLKHFWHDSRHVQYGCQGFAQKFSHMKSETTHNCDTKSKKMHRLNDDVENKMCQTKNGAKNVGVERNELSFFELWAILTTPMFRTANCVLHVYYMPISNNVRLDYVPYLTTENLTKNVYTAARRTARYASGCVLMRQTQLK